jgi:hypothetical protein
MRDLEDKFFQLRRVALVTHCDRKMTTGQLIW